MRNDNRCASLHHSAQASKYLSFGMCVDTGHRIIENQDCRVFGNGSSQSRALLLAPGERYSTFTYHRCNALWKISYILGKLGDLHDFSHTWFSQCLHSKTNVFG